MNGARCCGRLFRAAIAPKLSWLHTHGRVAHDLFEAMAILICEAMHRDRRDEFVPEV